MALLRKPCNRSLRKLQLVQLHYKITQNRGGLFFLQKRISEDFWMKMEFKRGAVRNAYNAGAFTYQENLCMDEAGD